MISSVIGISRLFYHRKARLDAYTHDPQRTHAHTLARSNARTSAPHARAGEGGPGASGRGSGSRKGVAEFFPKNTSPPHP